ncbi:MAG: hypothetical protein NC099_01445 [Corallococcus sp.]|nr:hypothetical protein [Bacillota bacterium]MCM1533298.1 hypothetical protein [Corallococcus sp.]
MNILNFLGSLLSPQDITLIVVLSVVFAVLLAGNIVLFWYYMHKRGERKLCTYQLQNKRDKLLEQLDTLRSGGAIDMSEFEEEEDDVEESMLVVDEDDDDDADEPTPQAQANYYGVVTQEDVDETMDAQILAVADLSAQAREKLGVAGEEFDRKRYYVRYTLSFEARLRLASEEVKARYVELMNELALYKGVNVKSSYRQQRIYKGRKTLGLITFSGRTLCVSFALNPADFAETKYRGIDKSGTKRYQKTPMMMRLSSARRLEYAKYLLVQLADSYTIIMEENPVAKEFDLAEKSYTDLYVENLAQITILGEVPESVKQVEEEEDEEELEELAEEGDIDLTEELTRYNRSYTARVIQADDELKARYSELKNHILTYKGVYNKITWKREAFYSEKRACIATFAIRGKTLCLFFAVDPSKFDGTKYKVVNRREKRPHAKMPTMFRITSDRSTKFAKEIMDVIFAEAGLTENPDYKQVNYRPPYRSTENLIKKGYIHAKTTVVVVPNDKEKKSVGKRRKASKTVSVAEQAAAATEAKASE